jgi:ATP-dependent DNA helicase Q1
MWVVSDQIQMLLERQEKLYDRQSELKALLEACKGLKDPVTKAASSTVEDWSGPFHWDSEADDVRFNVFGISAYRANQREVTALLCRFFYL